MRQPIRILNLQPFYGGSHRYFADGWIGHSRHDWTLMTLPARNWKWRMRHAAIEFARLVDTQWKSGIRWDAMLCTDMLNLAEFKGMLRTAARELPAVIYFHENQFAYPNQFDQPRDFHFGFTNFTSALTADSVWFNSRFNFDSMMSQLRALATQWPDYSPTLEIDSIESKSLVQPPGIELPENGPAKKDDDKPLHLVWAARWEHDKKPDDLLEILSRLHQHKFEFTVSVIGQSFDEVPAAFDAIRRKFSDRITHWGYQKSRQAYWQALSQADVFLSTADHEFFGIAAAEAVAMGLYPLLPHRLAYPELINAVQNADRIEKYLYENVDDAVQKILHLDNPSADTQLQCEIVQRYDWSVRGPAMDAQLLRLVK